MQLKYYVSHENQQMGPYSVDEIVSYVGAGTLSPLDYIYDEKIADWVLFLEHADLSEQVKKLKPNAPPQAQKGQTQAGAPVSHKKVSKPSYQKPGVQSENLAAAFRHEWFVLRGENKFGPFAYPDVIKMLQQGAVYEFDFAWCEGMPGWERIAQLQDFSKEALQKLKESSMPELSEVFFRRRHRRIKYGGTILIHDNKKVWKGTGVEISEGGAGVIMENAMVLPGQELFLHFKPGDGVPPFNALCEVVSKQFVKNISDPKAPIKYGLKFKNINTDTQNLLKEFAAKAA